MAIIFEKHAVLPGGYELLESLGPSGYGSGYCVRSWLAKHTGGQLVVVRYHNTRPSDEYGGFDDLRNRVQARLPHLDRLLLMPKTPGLVRWHSYHFDPDAGYLYLVRDYIAAKWMQCFPAAISGDRDGRPNADFLAAFRQVASALDFLVGWAGPDCDSSLHLNNLFLDGPQAVVADIGMRSLGEAIEFGYSGPRSLSESALEAPGHWFSWLSTPEHRPKGLLVELAATYYQARTGRPLFPVNSPSNTSIMDRLQQILREVTAYQQGRPLEFTRLPTAQERDVLAKALACDPDQRFSSCIEFVDSLQ
jgi:hypothetical protein